MRLKIRAVTVHEVELSLNSWIEDVKLMSKKIAEINEDVLSLRLSLEANYVDTSLLDKLSKLTRVNELNYISIWLEEVTALEEIVELLSISEKVYVSFMYSNDLPFKASELLFTVHERLSWSGCSRLGLSIGEPPQTPYFPVNRPEERGFSVSLLYPKHLLDLLNFGHSLSEALKLIAEHTLELCRGLERGLPFLGVDYSLSPWMDDSVVELIERVSGVEFGDPGTISAIVEVNRAIRTAAHKYEGIGFNEVMLPYAEDNRLKDLGRRGLLTLRDLMSYTVYCVAGLDMVLIPVSDGVKFADSMLRDLTETKALKGRCIGFRVLLADRPPGLEVNLGEFGVTPVLRVK